MSFTAVDLFAGIGGFHAAIQSLGGEVIFASEIDAAAARVYEHNWGLRPHGDIVPLTDGAMDVPEHDVLAAGFPCQPFSKSGFQRGMSETRGTLFFNICKILQARRPPVIVLENVRNLAGPRQRDTWSTIVRSLRELGYRVSETPAVFSPHLLPPERGGRPQVRERVFITGTYVGRERAERETDVPPVVVNGPVDGWSPLRWDLERHLPLDADVDLDRGTDLLAKYGLTEPETHWVEVWNDWLAHVDVDKLPGFPIWADAFQYPAVVPAGTPPWKREFLLKNAELYRAHKNQIDAWLRRHDGLRDLPPSRRKLEWQAQDTERNLWSCVLHFRPSGIRAKRPTYLPALVAITQTSVFGPRRRRITPREAARLQGLPEWFEFGDQRQSLTYKQLGNGVNVGAVNHVLREHVLRDAAEIAVVAPHLVEAVQAAPIAPIVVPHLTRAAAGTAA